MEDRREEQRDHERAGSAKTARSGSLSGMAVLLGCVLLISLGYAAGWIDRRSARRATGI